MYVGLNMPGKGSGEEKEDKNEKQNMKKKPVNSLWQTVTLFISLGGFMFTK